VPGYSSLSEFFGNHTDGEAVRYADLSYRQNIGWTPRHDSGRTVKARLSLTPAYRKIRSYSEGSMEARLEADRTIGQWNVGGAINLLSLSHDDTMGTGSSYSVADRRLELSQKYRLFEGASLQLLEVAGLANKTIGNSSSPAASLDSSLYYQIAPSFSWLLAKKGELSALYTYSVVPLPGEIDYRMARGFFGGVSHQVTITTDIKMGEQLLIIGSYRGDLRKPVNASGFDPANHVFSLEVRVFM
jgi:hypothetical protein